MEPARIDATGFGCALEQNARQTEITADQVPLDAPVRESEERVAISAFGCADDQFCGFVDPPLGDQPGRMLGRESHVLLWRFNAGLPRLEAYRAAFGQFCLIARLASLYGRGGSLIAGTAGGRASRIPTE